MSVLGINHESVSAWMVENVGAVAPLTFDLIAGGRSNLTYRVTDATGRHFALRRPPTSHVLPTAHDMVREHTIISALAPQGVPVAAPLGLCVDESINERPFYVMEFVEGHILRDATQASAAFTEAQRALIGPSLARTLSRLHDVDVDAAGLGTLARHDGYIERQVKRWRGQYEQMAVEGVTHDGLVEAVGDALAASIPTQQKVAVVHGDYRLDNTVLNNHGDVTAILDWEICTAPTTAPGFSTRAEVLAAYSDATSLDLSDVAFYQAFGYWKLACILQGVFARYRAGATAGDTGSVDEFPTHIRLLAETAKTTLESM